MKTTEPNQQKSYQEVKVGQTLYRVTSTYKGEFELDKALEDLTVKRVIQAATPSLLE